MEAAPPAPIPWIPEDDLLLKNAVEAGASLEALAKGAVQFSRKYTLRELQERWHSLLYDPDIAALASARMFELEISGFNPAPKLNRSENSFLGNKEVSRRRKNESIRRKFYAMRKKLRSEFFSNSDLVFFESNPDKHMIIDGNPLGQNCILGDGIPEHLRLQEEDLDILRHAFPETMTDIAVTSSATNGSKIGCSNSFEDNKRTGGVEVYGFDKNVTSALPESGSDILDINIKNGESPITLRESSINDDNLHNSSVGFEGRQQCNAPNSDGFPSFQEVVFPSGSPHLHHWGTMQDFPAPSVPVSMTLQDTAHFSEDIIPNDGESKEASSGLCTSEFADPDSLLNLSNEDEIMLGDVNEKNEDSKVCADNIDSVIQVCDKGIQENVIAKAEFETEVVSEASTVTVHTENPLEASSVTDHKGNPVVLDVAAPSILGDHQMNLQPAVDMPLRSTSKSDFTELSDGKICCVLNSEDTEIPCNDDIFLLIHPSTSFGSFAHTTSSPSMNASSSAHTKNSEQAVNWTAKATDSTKASGWPQKVGIHRLPEFNSVQPFVGRAAKTESHDSRSQVLPGVVDRTIEDSSQNRSLYAISKLSNDRLPEKEVARVDMKGGDNLATTAITGTREAGYGRSTISQPEPESSASDHAESEIDDDVPFFSDVEAMILDMDLDPYDHDSHITRKVPSYQFDETKRTIIRLEQGARSSLQRAMTSRGALGILYGRRLRHFIRKPEVLLGRSTDDIDVDIDLRKEGRANKISRRQAIIKMEADGSFFLKNLGKSAVSVNGMIVATGQLVNLSPSCLIEVKGMSFVFEINQGYVRKHIGNFCMKNKGKMGKSEWSAEDES